MGLLSTDGISLMAFASDEIIAQWKESVLEEERRKEQKLDITVYDRVAHQDVYTRVTARDSYLRTANADVYTKVAHTDTYTQSAARNTYSRVAERNSYSKTVSRDDYNRIDTRNTYSKVTARDAYSETVARNTYSKIDTRNTYTETIARDTYSRTAERNTYTQKAQRDSYSQVAERNSYNQTAQRNTYSRVDARDTYSRVDTRNTYSRVDPRDTYSQVAERNTYSQTNPRDTYSQVAERNTYSQVAERNTYSQVAERNTYSRQSARNSYSRQSARNSYSRQSARNSYSRESARNSYSRESARNSYSRESKRNRYTRYGAAGSSRHHADVYSRQAARNSYSRQSARNSYSRESARNSYSRESARNSYSRESARNSYSRESARNSYSREVHTNTYSREAHTNTYSREAHTNTYDRVAHDNTYTRVTHSNTYTRVAHTDTYDRVAHANTYTRVAHTNTYDKVAHTNTYDKLAHTNAYTRVAHRDTYDRVAHTNAYTRVAHSDTYDRVTHTNTYSRVPHTNTYTRVSHVNAYSRVAHTDTYTQAAHRNTYTRTEQRDEYARAAHANTYTRVAARDTYQKVTARNSGFDHENYVPSAPELYGIDGKVISQELEVRLISYDKNEDGYGSQDTESADIYYTVEMRRVQNLIGEEDVTEWETLQDMSMTEDFNVSLAEYPSGLYEVRTRAFNQPRKENGVEKTYVSDERICTFMIIDGKTGQDLTILNASEFYDYAYGNETYATRDDNIMRYVDSIIYEHSDNQKGLFMEIELEDVDEGTYHTSQAALYVDGKRITDYYGVVYECDDDGNTMPGRKTGVVFIPLEDMLDDGSFEDVKVALKTDEFADPDFTEKIGDTSVQFGVSQAKDIVFVDLDNQNPDITIEKVISDELKYTSEVNVQISFSDVGLGLGQQMYQVVAEGENPKDNAWTESENDIVNVTLTEKGSYDIYARAIDKAGNETITHKTYEVLFANLVLVLPENIYQGDGLNIVGTNSSDMEVESVKFWIENYGGKEAGKLEATRTYDDRTETDYSATLDETLNLPRGVHNIFMETVFITPDGERTVRTISEQITVIESIPPTVVPQESDKDGNEIDPFLIQYKNLDTLVIQEGDKFTPIYYIKATEDMGIDCTYNTTCVNNVPLDSSGRAQSPGIYDVVYTAKNGRGKTSVYTLPVIVNKAPEVRVRERYFYTGDVTKDALVKKITINDKEDGVIEPMASMITLKKNDDGTIEATVTVTDSMKGTTTKKFKLNIISHANNTEGPRYISKDHIDSLPEDSIWTEEEYNELLENSLNNDTPIRTYKGNQ